MFPAIVCELEHGVGLVIHHSQDTDNPTCQQSPANPSHRDPPFRYTIVPTHHSVNGLIGTPCLGPTVAYVFSKCIFFAYLLGPVWYYRVTEPALNVHHTTSLQGYWYTWAYKRVPTLDDVRLRLDFTRPGPIYVVTRGSRVGFFPSS